MSGLIIVKCTRLPTILLNSIGSIVDPSSSLLNFKPVITSIGVDLQLEILNIFKMYLHTLTVIYKYHFQTARNQCPKKNFMSPKSVISNSLSMTVLNYFMPKSPINIKSSTYRKIVNMLPFSFTLVYSVSSL